MSDPTTRFTLAVPPSLNAYIRYRVTHSRKPRAMSYKTSEATEYQRLAANTARAAGVRLIPKPTKVKLSVLWYRERKAGDLDNRLKVLVDSLEGVAFDNDSQIAQIEARYDDTEPGNPRMVVAVVPLEAPQATFELPTDAE